MLFLSFILYTIQLLIQWLVKYTNTITFNYYFHLGSLDFLMDLSHFFTPSARIDVADGVKNNK